MENLEDLLEMGELKEPNDVLKTTTYKENINKKGDIETSKSPKKEKRDGFGVTKNVSGDKEIEVIRFYSKKGLDPMTSILYLRKKQKTEVFIENGVYFTVIHKKNIVSFKKSDIDNYEFTTKLKPNIVDILFAIVVLAIFLFKGNVEVSIFPLFTFLSSMSIRTMEISLKNGCKARVYYKKKEHAQYLIEKLR